MDLRRPFRHTDAISRGALTRHHLVDGSYRPLFPGVSVDGRVVVTMELRATGAVLARPRGVVAGRAAAAVWDVDDASPDTTVDLLLDVGGVRSCSGVRLRRDVLCEDEVARVDALRVTSPARTALDLARWLPPAEAVVLLDALGRRTSLEVAAVRALADRHAGERGVAQVEAVLGWVDPRSPGPGASRLRVGLLARGVAVPLVAQRLLDGEGRPVAELALAWPEVRVGITHTAGVRRTAGAVGWEVLEVREDAAREWGTRRAAAPIDQLATWVLRAADRWDPAPRVGGRSPGRLPRPPGPDGECDGGLSRLVPA